MLSRKDKSKSTMLRQTTGNNKALSLNFHFLLFTPTCTLFPPPSQDSLIWRSSSVITHPSIPSPIQQWNIYTHPICVSISAWKYVGLQKRKTQKQVPTADGRRRKRRWAPKQTGESTELSRVCSEGSPARIKGQTGNYSHNPMHSNSQTLNTVYHTW